MSMHRRVHIIALFHLYTHENCHSVFLGPGQLKTVPKILSCPAIQVKLALWELLQWLFLGKGHTEFPLGLRKSLDLYYQTVSVKTEGVFLFALVTGKLGDKLATSTIRGQVLLFPLVLNSYQYLTSLQFIEFIWHIYLRQIQILSQWEGK